jgi:hypothetical protein
VGPKAGLEAVTRKIPSPCRNSKPGSPTSSLVTTLTEVFRLPQFRLMQFCVSFNSSEQCSTLRISIYLHLTEKLLIRLAASVFHKLSPVACSESELTSETMNPFGHFGRTPWMGDGPISRPLNLQRIEHR